MLILMNNLNACKQESQPITSCLLQKDGQSLNPEPHLYQASSPEKEDAIRYGRELSRKEQTELYIHKKDGTIQNRNSYGNDPFPPADRVK